MRTSPTVRAGEGDAVAEGADANAESTASSGLDDDVEADESLTAAVAALVDRVEPAARRPGHRAAVAALIASTVLHGVILSAAVFATIGAVRVAKEVRPGAGDEAVVTDMLSPTNADDTVPAVTPLPAPDATDSTTPAPVERPAMPEAADTANAPLPEPTLAAFEEPLIAPTMGMTATSADALPKRPRRSPPVATAATTTDDPQAAAPSQTVPVAPAAPATPVAVTPVKVARAGGRTGRRSGYDDRGLPIPDYPAESRRRREQGLVELDVEILTDGKVGEVKVVTDPGHARLVEAAIAAVKRGDFEAATANGKPVTGHVVVPFRFVLH